MNAYLIIIVLFLFYLAFYAPRSNFVPAPQIPLYNLNGSPQLTYDIGGAFNNGNQAPVLRLEALQN